MKLFGKKKRVHPPAPETIPAHIAIIMDGNGRWAQARGLPRTAGHSAGSETFRRMATYMNGLGVQYLTVYAFSTENWKRAKDEVDAIMALLERYLLEARRDMEKENIRLGFFGDTQALSAPLRALIEDTDRISRHTSGLQVNVCLNYGGRAELVRAARLLADMCRRGEIQSRDITEDMLGAQLYSGGMPDPDLIIRPGGEMRVSNFLLWQGAYSEFYFTDVLWPDFDEAELNAAIAEYNRRTRRFGGTGSAGGTGTPPARPV